MRIYKVITAVTIVLAGLKSCNMELPFVTKEALESSMQQTKEANQALQSVQENYERQNRELSSILAELSDLSCQTTTLQLSVENGGGQITQAEQIGRNLEAVKSRIDRLESEAARARKLDGEMALSAKTIKRLRTTVENQLKEIDHLRRIVVEKDATIRTQGHIITGQRDTISAQLQTILQQKAELKKALEAQTNIVYKAGCDLERLGDECDEMLTVNGRKDREKVTAYKKVVYSKADELFRQAAGQNHVGATGRLEVISYKIQSL